MKQQEKDQGLASISTKWEGFEEVAEAMGDMRDLRASGESQELIKAYRELMEALSSVDSSSRKFSRDEMNERR